MTDITITVPPEAHRAFLAVAPEPSESETAVLANPAHSLHAEALLRKALRENPPPPETVPVEAGQRRLRAAGPTDVLAVDGEWVWVQDNSAAPWTVRVETVETWPLVEPVHVPGTRVGDPLTPDTPPGAKVSCGNSDCPGPHVLDRRKLPAESQRPGWWLESTLPSSHIGISDEFAADWRVVALPGDGAS